MPQLVISDNVSGSSFIAWVLAYDKLDTGSQYWSSYRYNPIFSSRACHVLFAINICDAEMVVWMKQAIMEFCIGVLSIFPYIFINLLYMPDTFSNVIR